MEKENKGKKSSRQPFDEFDVKQALADLQKYREGKYSIDEKAKENQEWWRLRHTDISPDSEFENSRSVSAWAVNSILNKHADIMDSFPMPNILPREADDESEAKILTDIVPVALELNNYEDVYRQSAWDFCIDGGCITGVFWDNTKNEGLGDITISNVDVHNLFWQPGINDIQKSDKVFFVCLEETDKVKAMYPKIADRIGPLDTGTVMKYMHDDNIDTSDYTEVVNMYYKKTVGIPIQQMGVDDNGKATTIEVMMPKTYLHLAIIVGSQLAYCSENDPACAEGFYEHGKYPFVIRRTFPIKDTPWGFGYLDIMKNPQMYIDAMDEDIISVADMKARPRYWARKNANINLEQFADWNQQIVEVGTGELGDAVRKIDVDDVPTGIMQHRLNKIDELKETSGNRDFNQGGVSGGVTAASAVAALQEQGSKLSRDLNKEMYRGAREEFLLVIELIRQFYTEPRSFRINGNLGDLRFVQYSNAGIVKKDMKLPDGTVRHRRPMFDIKISAEKQSPFVRAAQNETAKELYGMGMFAPEMELPALTCLEMMDFEGKEKIKQMIQQNGMFTQQFQSAMQIITMLAQQHPEVMQMAMQAGLIAPEQAQQMMAEAQPQGGSSEQGTPEERAAKKTTGNGNSMAAKARLRAANAASPQ